MAKIKFQVEANAFDQTGFSEAPKPGVYVAQVKEINAGYSKGDDGQEDKSRPRLEVIYEIVDEKAKTKGNDGGSANGARIWDYVTFGKGSQWKLASFLAAFGLGDKTNTQGEFDTAKIAAKVADISTAGKKVTKETGHPGMKCRLRLKADSDQDGNYRAKVASILPLAGDVDEDVESDVVEEDVADDMVEDEAATGYTEDELKSLDVTALKEVVVSFNEAGHELVIKGKKKSEVIAMILAAQEDIVDAEIVEDDEEVIDDDDEATPGYDEAALKAMTVSDLKEVAKTMDVDFGGKKKSEVIAAILEAQASGGGGGSSTAAVADDDLPF